MQPASNLMGWTYYTHDGDHGPKRIDYLPWNAPTDLKEFKRITTTRPPAAICVMGSKTYEALPPKKLEGRTIVVLTRNSKDYHTTRTTDYAMTYQEFNDYLEQIHNQRHVIGNFTVFVCGGKEIYRLLADHMMGMIYHEMSNVSRGVPTPKGTVQSGPHQVKFPMNDVFKSKWLIASMSPPVEYSDTDDRTWTQFCLVRPRDNELSTMHRLMFLQDLYAMEGSIQYSTEEAYSFTAT